MAASFRSHYSLEDIPSGGGLDERALPGSIHLNTWSPVSGTVWRGLGGVALLDCVTGSRLRGFKKLPLFPGVPFPSLAPATMPTCSSILLGQSSLIQEKNTQHLELVVDRSCHSIDIGMGRAEDS